MCGSIQQFAAEQIFYNEGKSFVLVFYPLFNKTGVCVWHCRARTVV